MIIVNSVSINEEWFDGTVESYSFDITLSPIGLPDSMVNEAQFQDKENYIPTCFMTKVRYEHDTDNDKYDMYIDTEWDCDIAYITNDGDPICFDYKLKDYELQTIFQMCYDELWKTKKGCEK